MVDYLLRMEDETLTVDLLPMLTLMCVSTISVSSLINTGHILFSVKVGKVYGQHGKAGVPSLSMGACLELLPLLHPLLESIYDRSDSFRSTLSANNGKSVITVTC
jgi:hypothetical protein